MAKTTTFEIQVAQAVKAELARRNLTINALVPVLNRSRNIVYGRLRGESSFTVAELEQIVEFLGLDMASFMLSLSRMEQVAA